MVKPNTTQPKIGRDGTYYMFSSGYLIYANSYNPMHKVKKYRYGLIHGNIVARVNIKIKPHVETPLRRVAKIAKEMWDKNS